MWYYALDGERKGPVSEEDLVQMINEGDLGLDDHVWKAGMDDWTQISDVEDIPPTPPPPPGKQPRASTHASSQEEQSPTGGKTDSDLGASGASSSTEAKTTSVGHGRQAAGPKVADDGSTSEITYAGFGRRLIAYVVDFVILFVAFVVFGGVLIALSGTSQVPSEEELNVLGFLVSWMYFALNESSERQATWGKQLMGLKVTDLNGDKIGFGKATGRHFGKILSSLILLIGYIMAAFTEKKQALHDKMAGCLVVKASGEKDEDVSEIGRKNKAREANRETEGRAVDGPGELYCERSKKAVDPIPDSRTYREYTCPSCRQDVEDGRHPPVEEVR